MNLIKINNGFIKDDKEFLFQSFLNEQEESVNYEILSDSQTHIGTDNGIMFLDLSVTINTQSFTDINDFVNFLYS